MNANRAFPRGPNTPRADLADRTPAAQEDFARRLMAAIEREPTPTPTRNLLSAVQTRSFRDAAAALWVAWHLGTVRTWRIAPAVRARSLALVLAAACVLATGSLAAAAALRVAADPVVDMFQSGVEEKGAVESLSPDADEEEHQLDEGDQAGVEAPPTDDQRDQLDIDEHGANDDDHPGVDGPSTNEQGGQAGADEQDATDQIDQPGSDQAGNGNAGQSRSNRENASPATTDSGGSSGASGSSQDGTSNDDNSNP